MEVLRWWEHWPWRSIRWQSSDSGADGDSCSAHCRFIRLLLLQTVDFYTCSSSLYICSTCTVDVYNCSFCTPSRLTASAPAILETSTAAAPAALYTSTATTTASAYYWRLQLQLLPHCRLPQLQLQLLHTINVYSYNSCTLKTSTAAASHTQLLHTVDLHCYSYCTL